MRREQKLKALLLTSSVWMLVTTPAWSQIVKTQGVQQGSSDQRLPLLSKAELVEPIREIRHLSEIEHPSKSARMLVQSSTPPNPPSVLPSPGGKQGGGVVEVTGVKANPTDKGVEVILQTTKGQALQLVNRSTGNTFIAEIPNAQLRLPSGEGFTFRSQKPIAGVTEITVTNFDAKTIRVTVTGEAGAPIVELYDSPNEGLIFSVASTAPSAQNPTQPSPNLGERQTEGSQTSQNPAQPENQTQLLVLAWGLFISRFCQFPCTPATVARFCQRVCLVSMQMGQRLSQPRANNLKWV